MPLLSLTITEVLIDAQRPRKLERVFILVL